MPSLAPLTGVITPMPFQAAVTRLAARGVVPSSMRTRDWLEIPVAIRERSIWSAGVESAKLVQSFKDTLLDFLDQHVGELPTGEKYLKAGGRQSFVKQMKEFIEAEGIPRPQARGGILDIGSSKRLKLIFNTQTSLANNYGYWKQGNNRAILDAFPAMRFIRVVQVETPRPLHAENEDAVRLKDDLDFWLSMNDPDIGGFGVPYGPWGFNSGMDTEDVGRDEAEELGLIGKDEQVENPEVGYNDYLKQSITGLSPELRDRLQSNFGTVLKLEGESVTFK